MKQKYQHRLVVTIIFSWLALLGWVSLGWLKCNDRFVIALTNNNTISHANTEDNQNLVIENGVVCGFKRGYVADNLNLVIPAQTKTGFVTKIADEAFESQSGIKTVYINHGICEIGARAFAWCIDLEKIFIPSSVTSIGANILNQCLSLTSAGVINHSGVLFDWWVQNHYYGAVCLNEMETINLTIYQNSINKPFHTISCGAFRNCHKLHHIILSGSVIKLDNDIFWSVKKLPLKTIHIEANDLSVNPTSFFGVMSECEYYVSSSSVASKIIFGHANRGQINVPMEDFYLKWGDEKITLSALTPQGKLATTLTVPLCVNAVSKNAFEGFCDELKLIIIHSDDLNLEQSTLAKIPLHVRFEVTSRKIKARLISQQINPARIKINNFASGTNQAKIVWKKKTPPPPQKFTKAWMAASVVSCGIIVGVATGIGWWLTQCYKK